MDTTAQDKTTSTRTAPALAGAALALTAALALSGCAGDPADPETTTTDTASAAQGSETAAPTESAAASASPSEDATDGPGDDASPTGTAPSAEDPGSGASPSVSPSGSAEPTESTVPTEGGGTAVSPDEAELAVIVGIVEEHFGPHANALTRTAEQTRESAEELIAEEEERSRGAFSEECVAQLIAPHAVHRDADIALTQVNGSPQEMDTMESWTVNREDADSPQTAMAVRDAAVTYIEVPACADEEGFLVPDVDRSAQQPWGEGTVEHVVTGNLDEDGLRTVQTFALEGSRVYEISHPAMGAEQAEDVKHRNEALLEDLRAATQEG